MKPMHQPSGSINPPRATTTPGEMPDVLVVLLGDSGGPGRSVCDVTTDDVAELETRVTDWVVDFVSRSRREGRPFSARLVHAQRSLAPAARHGDGGGSSEGRDPSGRGVPSDGGAATDDSADADREAPRLTGRELQVLRLLAEGLTKREIARHLYISHNTIHSHTRAIYRKLGVSSRAGALTAAHIDGLL